MTPSPSHIISTPEFTISLVSKDSIKTFSINGKTFPIDNIRGVTILNGKSPERFVKEIKQDRLEKKLGILKLF